MHPRWDAKRCTPSCTFLEQGLWKFIFFAIFVKKCVMTNSLLSHITIDAAVCKGNPSIRGMRFTVAQMLELIASGMSFEEILADYPYIERDDILACLQYASFVMNNKDIVRLNEVA
jgi:uncharacterized protein (DUF433 family)